MKASNFISYALLSIIPISILNAEEEILNLNPIINNDVYEADIEMPGNGPHEPTEENTEFIPFIEEEEEKASSLTEDKSHGGGRQPDDEPSETDDVHKEEEIEIETEESEREEVELEEEIIPPANRPKEENTRTSIKERPSGSEFITNLIFSYSIGQYHDFLDDMEAKYQGHPGAYADTARKDEALFWENIQKQNYNNKLAFIDKLQMFSGDHPSSSLGKTIQEFLSYSLSDEERLDLYFFSGSLTGMSRSIIEDSKTFESLWKELKTISYSFKVKHAILNDEFLTTDTKNEQLRAQHIILDIAMKEAMTSILDMDSPMILKLENSFSSYLKYLGFEYNSHYLLLLLDGALEASSKNEIYVKSLINDFRNMETKIKKEQLDWIETACDGGYTEM